jgi:hypothetical protein
MESGTVSPRYSVAVREPKHFSSVEYKSKNLQVQRRIPNPHRNPSVRRLLLDLNPVLNPALLALVVLGVSVPLLYLALNRGPLLLFVSGDLYDRPILVSVSVEGKPDGWIPEGDVDRRECDSCPRFSECRFLVSCFLVFFPGSGTVFWCFSPFLFFRLI